MSESTRRANLWVPGVIMIVVTIMFSVYAIQSHSDLVDARDENQQLTARVEACVRAAMEAQQNAARAMQLAAEEANRANREAEASRKSNKRK